MEARSTSSSWVSSAEGAGKGAGGGQQQQQQQQQPIYFEGECNHCKRYGHKRADCWWKDTPADQIPPPRQRPIKGPGGKGGGGKLKGGGKPKGGGAGGDGGGGGASQPKVAAPPAGAMISDEHPFAKAFAHSMEKKCRSSNAATSKI